MSVGVHCTDRRGPSIVLILLNKPYQVLSQFSDARGRATLADYVDAPGVYPAGRLDYDSEGLVLLTDDGKLQARISQPRSKIPKTYWAQVEGTAGEQQLNALLRGVQLKDGPAKARSAASIKPPEDLWSRDPPIRYRASVADSWITVTLTQGRNRQVRRMTAAVGLPTLRLIRYSVGPWSLAGLRPGESRQISTEDAWKAL
ncbi:MAG: pseudouridine synthase [Gammaproteobacteria bacterium]|nr:pseudouridine synthase [Gammaproteobacteria bacterium]MBT8111134.1 pseudouridine synthase [Gammaproteobacteria bacterium]NND46026.1 pseudouridine synthase [Woeseiaceae bacterium]NNL45832.1 pseudouridine synthase [Woeseiaceae bacterium]